MDNRSMRPMPGFWACVSAVRADAVRPARSCALSPAANRRCCR